MMKPVLLTALACLQLFVVNPQSDSLSNFSTKARAPASRAQTIPHNLEEKLLPLFEQGFHLMSWKLSASGLDYVVELYHPFPDEIRPTRPEYQDAASRGLGVTQKRLIPVK